MFRVRPRLFPVVALIAILAGCADEPVASPPSSAENVGSATTASTLQVTTTVLSSDDAIAPDYAALIAAVESEMDGTSYAGAALEDPEVFIATAELFCDLLAEGMTSEQLLSEYLNRLSDDGAVEVDEEDGLMAGVLLGAATQIVCPDDLRSSP